MTHADYDCDDLIALLREAAPMHAADIPTDSMIREFIGQGEFEY